MANGASIVDIANNSTSATAEVDFVAIFPNVQVALQQFNAVRYVAVACLTMAILDRILACPKETCKLYRAPLTVIKSLYFANRYINLICLGIDVFLYTQWLFTDKETCIWWFSFRAWTGVVVVVAIEALLIWRLYLMYDRKQFVGIGFGLVVVAQIVADSFLTRHVVSQVSAVPSPGVWFSGCFPVFDCTLLWANWLTSMVIKIALCLAAILATFMAWSTSRGQKTLWRASEENGIRFYLAIAATSIFVTVWWMTAPLPLKSMSPTVASALYLVFGSRLVVNMNQYRCGAPPNPPVELRVITPNKGQIASQDSGLDVPPQADLEKGLRVATFDLSPHSQVSTLHSPDTKRESGLQMIPGSVDTLHERTEAGEAAFPCSQTSLSATIITTVHHPPVFAILQPEDQPVASSSRRPFSEEAPRTPRDIETVITEEDDELDRELAEEYDEDGQRRKPRRTHTRRWKSEEVTPRVLYTDSAVHIPSPLGPVAGPSTPRPSRMCGVGPFGRVRSPSRPSSPASPPPEAGSPRRSSFERAPASRHRLSQFLHLHRSEAESATVLEEDLVDQDIDGSPNNRLSRTSSHHASRLRRMLASSPPPSPSSIRTTLKRRESDALTIASASTTFQFDNTFVHEAPDFTN